MSAAVSSYPPNAYHQQSYHNSKLGGFYRTQYIPKSYYNSKTQKQQQQQQRPRTPTPTTPTEQIESNRSQLRPRREPRIHRQVIVLPTPEPIYRQVRHRLPTPERKVIQRTVIHKPNGDIVVQQERHNKKSRSQSRSKNTTQTRSSRI